MEERKKKRKKYIAPEGPRKLKEGDTRKFRVAAHRKIRDSENNYVSGGQNAMLTEQLANHYAKLNYLDVEFDFDKDAGKDAEIATLKSQLADAGTRIKDEKDVEIAALKHALAQANVGTDENAVSTGEVETVDVDAADASGTQPAGDGGGSAVGKTDGKPRKRGKPATL